MVYCRHMLGEYRALGESGELGARARVFYGVFAGFMVLVVAFTAVAVWEYAAERAAGRPGGTGLFIGSIVLFVLAVWWLVDALLRTPPNTLAQVLRAVVFLLAAGPILSPPVLATARGAVQTLGRLRRVLWRPASIIGVVMIVLWFLS